MKRLAHSLALLLLAACPKKSAPAPPDSGVASAASSAVPAPALATLGATFDRDFSGTVAGKNVYASRVRAAAGAHGKYFYADVGVDLVLEGTVDAKGDFALDEKSSGKVTGKWTLREDPVETLSGTWSDAAGKHPSPATLKAVVRAPHTPVLVVTRRIRGVDHACKIDIEVPVVLGLADRKLETTLNDRFFATKTPACANTSMGVGETKGKWDTSANDKGVLSIHWFRSSFAPWMIGGYTGSSEEDHVNAAIDAGIVDVPVEKILNLEHPALRAKLSAAVSAHVSEEDPASLHDAFVEEFLHPKEVHLTPKAVVFCGTSAGGFAYRVLNQCFYDVPFTDLKDILLPGSPIADLWR